MEEREREIISNQMKEMISIAMSALKSKCGRQRWGEEVRRSGISLWRCCGS